MDPHITKNDMKMFYKYLNKANVYFEYGSGGSTYQASIRDNIKKIYSVESDIKWQKKLKKKITNKNVNYILNDMDTIPGDWGNPGKNATEQQKKNYSEQIKKLGKEEQELIDFILIDGRFRVSCCLKCHNVIQDNCLIAFDDFLIRRKYHIVLDYFDIIDKTKDKRMVILKKKKNICVSDEIIKKYELISA